MKFFGLVYGGLLLCMAGEPSFIKAQPPGLYLDFGSNFGFIYARELSNFAQALPSVQSRIGIGFWKSNDHKYILSAEFGGGMRKFTRNYSGDVIPMALGPLELAVIASRNLNDRWRLEWGTAIVGVHDNWSSGSYSYPRLAAEDYSGWDITAHVGAEFALGKVFSFVARAHWGFVPQLSYQPIGDFGELETPFNDIFYRSIHVGLRFNILKKYVE